jgi:glycosyltransferase involved in cell wall biosynthesis
MTKGKILVVGSSLEDKGGITTVMTNIKNSFIANEYNMEFISTYITGTIFKRTFYYFSGILNLLLKLVRKRPDIVHIHMSYKGSFYRKSLIIMIVKIFKVPIILHIHGSTFKDFYRNLSPIKRRYCNYVLNLPDKLLVLSQEWKRFFSNFVNPEKISTLYNGVFVSSEKKEYIQREIPTLLFLGRLGKRKGVYDLIEAIKEIDKNRYKFQCILAGDGEVEEVKELIEKKGLNNHIKCTGWIGPETKKKLIEDSDILILPSYNEGLPMAILEAMEQGLSVISTNVGGIPELVTAKNGILTKPGDIISIQKAIIELISNPEKRKFMFRNNINEIQKKYNLEDILLKLKGIYQLTISKKR